MYYSYVDIEYVATSFSPARTDLALKLLSQNIYKKQNYCCTSKVNGSWGRRLLAVAGEVTQHGRAHPYSWSITIISLRSKESEESQRSEWKTELLGMFLAVTCQHASGACQSHSRPVLNLREASRKYVELSPSTSPFLTLRFYEKDLMPTPNLLQISGRYSLRSGTSFQSPQGHSGDWVSRMIL